MGVYELYPFQKTVVAQTYGSIRRGAKRVLIVSPTGSGKTVISSRIVKDAASRKRLVLIVVHREELVSQTYEKLQDSGISDCGFIKAGWSEDRKAQIQIASVQTLLRRDWWQELPFDLVLLDEAHITGWHKIIQKTINEIHPSAIYLGLTATPYRSSAKEQMGDIFEEVVCAPFPYQLMEMGFLVKPSYHQINEADLDSVKVVGSEFGDEYDRKQLAILCDRPELIEQARDAWKNLAWGRPTIAFGVSRKHAWNLCEAFRSEGIPWAYIDGNTPRSERNKYYEQLARGEIFGIANYGVLTEGFDCRPVSTILDCAPTYSKARHLQKLGRALRLSPETGKTDCIIIDQAGNLGRHQYVESVREISLFEDKSSGKGSPPMKVCPTEQGGCGKVLYAVQKSCPYCQFSFAIERIPALLEIKQHIPEEDRSKLENYRAKLKVAHQNSWSPGWAAVKFKEENGYWPPEDWGRAALFGDTPTALDKLSYERHLTAIAQRLEKTDSWVERYVRMEFANG